MTRRIRITIILMTCAAWRSLGAAQQIASIDLTGGQPRFDLRFPVAAPSKSSQEGACSAGGSGGMSIAWGGAAPGEFRVDLDYLDRSEYLHGDGEELEATIENVGNHPPPIPWSPHLADWQPADEKAKFVVRELQVGLFLNWSGGYCTCLGWLNLYGDPLHPGTVTTLNPGERWRIRGQSTVLATHDDGTILPALQLAQRASARTLLRDVEFAPRPGGLWQRITNQSPKEVAGTDLPIHVFAAPANN